MPQQSLVPPPLTSREASPVEVSALEPVAAPSPVAAARAARFNSVLQKLQNRRNAFWEALHSPEARWSWASSLALHVVLLLGLALVFLAPGRKDDRAELITAADALDGPSGPGEMVGDVVGDVGAEIVAVPTPNIAAMGGSLGNVRPSLSSVFGQGPGFGHGSGGGLGDALGAMIAGRVQAAGGKGGKLQMSLAWDDRNDLDLHVVTPLGERIFYGAPKAPSGGVLDVDMNVRPQSDEPVENITWMEHTPPDGTYRIQVHFFARHSGQPAQSAFNVRLQIGSEVRIFKGTASPGKLLEVASFEIKDSRGGEITSGLKEFTEADSPIRELDGKREENRERFARDAFNEANAEADPRIKAGMLRRVIQRFGGTPAAEQAQQVLNQLDPPKSP